MIVHVSRLTEPDTREPADPTTHHAQENIWFAWAN
jgi:hypothetical protein